MKGSKEIFSNLWAIPQAKIDADIKLFSDNLDGLMGEINILKNVVRKSESTAEAAKLIHLRLLFAHSCYAVPHLSHEERVFGAVRIVESVMDDAAMLALGQGELAALSTELQEIEKREGLKSSEYWPRGEAPTDYEEITKRQEAKIDAIQETVGAVLLRKYRLGDLAELLESNRSEFEILREIGRSVTMWERDNWDERVAANTRLYGNAAAQRISERVLAILRGSNTSR